MYFYLYYCSTFYNKCSYTWGWILGCCWWSNSFRWTAADILCPDWSFSSSIRWDTPCHSRPCTQGLHCALRCLLQWLNNQDSDNQPRSATTSGPEMNLMDVFLALLTAKTQLRRITPETFILLMEMFCCIPGICLQPPQQHWLTLALAMAGGEERQAAVVQLS